MKQFIFKLLPKWVKKRIKLLWLRSSANRKIKLYLNSNSLKKLHIGAGSNELYGWLNTDIEPLSPNIVFLDASKTFPIPDQSFDYIFSEHVFEHLTLEQQISMLKESHRILKPGGKIRIATPDFDFIISILNNKNPDVREYINWNFDAFLKPVRNHLGEAIEKDIFVINNFFRDWGHQFIHNVTSLKLFLEKNNFKDLTQFKIGQSDDKDLCNLENHGAVISEKFNRMETIILEATKK